jgi:4-amino-4-deoxy-L-arabinose transferase
MKREFEARTAALTVFIFLTCIMVMGLGTFSLLDSMVTGFITLTLCSLYAALGATGKSRIGLLALTGALAGGAFLVKGFIALAVPVVVIVPYLLIRREWKQLFILPWIPLISALVVALPWCIAIAMKEPDYWHYFFWEEHIRRFSSRENAQHEAPFWYFIPVFIGGGMPWMLIAPIPLRNLLRTRLKEPIIQYGLCWMIAPFLFFSASSGKLGTYILPCFAPFALLLARALTDRFEQREKNRYLQVGLVIFTGVIALALAALPVIGGLNAFKLLPPLDPRFLIKFAGLLIGFTTALLLLLSAIKTGDNLRKTVLLGLAAAMVFVVAQAGAPSEISTGLGIQHFLESEQSHIDPDTILIGNPKTTHALCYVYKRDNVYLFGGKSEFAYGLSYPDSEDRYLEIPQLQSLLNQRGNHRVVICIKSPPNDRMRAELPLPTYQRQWLKIWFAVYEPPTREPQKD